MADGKEQMFGIPSLQEAEKEPRCLTLDIFAPRLSHGSQFPWLSVPMALKSTQACLSTPNFPPRQDRSMQLIKRGQPWLAGLHIQSS